MKTGALIAVVAVTLTCGCATATSTTPDARATAPTAGVPNAGGAATSTGTAAASGLNTTDLAWLQLMAAMNKRALSMLDDASDRSASPRLARLTTEVRAGHRTELAKFNALLGPAGTAVDNPHEGHDMPGMASPAVLTIMASLDDTAFDRLLVRHLRAHLTQSALVSRGEQSSGADPGAKSLAADIERTRKRQLAELDAVGG
jgi:uncharacterized protein (DUF305 family)